jgi:hypothetical protein
MSGNRRTIKEIREDFEFDKINLTEISGDDVEFLFAEIERLERWIDDLQSGMYINCVYCGHRYPPGTNAVKRKVLYEHIKICPKHPLSQAEARIVVLQAKLRSICPHKKAHSEDWPDGGVIEVCDDCGMSRYLWEQGETDWIWVKDIPGARQVMQETLDKLRMKGDKSHRPSKS